MATLGCAGSRPERGEQSCGSGADAMGVIDRLGGCKHQGTGAQRRHARGRRDLSCNRAAVARAPSMFPQLTANPSDQLAGGGSMLQPYTGSGGSAQSE